MTMNNSKRTPRLGKKPSLKKRPAHRPIKPIDWNVVDSYLEAQVSGAKIAAKLRIDPVTLYRRCEDEKGVTFSEYDQSRKGSGQADLAKKQYEVAMDGNSTLLLHLGEHILGQGKQEEKISPFEDVAELRHKLMIVEAERDKLQEQINAHQPQTEQIIRGSDAPL